MRSLILEKGPVFRRRALLVTIAASPVLILLMLNDPINVPKLAFVTLMVTMVGGVRVLEISQGGSREGLGRLIVPVAALTVPLALAWVASPYRYWALFGQYRRFEGLIPYLVIAVLGLLVADAFGGRAREVAWAFVIGASVVSAYALFQFAGVDPVEWQAAAGGDLGAAGTLGNPNFLGGFLGICVGPLAALWLVDPARRRILAAASFLILGALIVSFSQGGWAAGAAGAAVVGGAALQARWKYARMAGVLAAFGVATLVVGQVLLGVIDPTNRLVPTTVRVRSEAWQGAVSMTMEHPLLGRGPNAYAVEGVHHRTPEDALRLGYRYPDDPHSIVMSFATSAGLLGLIGLAFAFGWLFREGLRGPRGDLLLAGFLGGLIAYLVQALVSLDTVALRIGLWVMAAGLIATLHDRTPDPQPSRRRRKRKVRRPLANVPVVAATLVISLAVVAWTVGFVWADAQVWKGTTHLVNRRPFEAQAAYERAIAFRGDYEYRRTFGRLIGRVAAASGHRELFEAARSAYSFVEHFPHVERLGEYAGLLDAWGDIDPAADEEALEVYRRMRELDPFNPEIRVEMAAVLIDLGRAADAVEALEPLLAYLEEGGDFSGRRDFWGVLALGRAHLGDEEGAEQAIDRALEGDRSDPSALEARQVLQDQETD